MLSCRGRTAPNFAARRLDPGPRGLSFPLCHALPGGLLLMRLSRRAFAALGHHECVVLLCRCLPGAGASLGDDAVEVARCVSWNLSGFAQQRKSACTLV